MIFHGCFLSNGAWLVAQHVCFDTTFEYSVLFCLLAVLFAQGEESFPHGSSLPMFHHFLNTTCKRLPLVLRMKMRQSEVHIEFG